MFLAYLEIRITAIRIPGGSCISHGSARVLLGTFGYQGVHCSLLVNPEGLDQAETRAAAASRVMASASATMS